MAAVTIYSMAVCPFAQRTRDALLAHSAAVETSLPEDDYIKLYEDYSLGVANGGVPPGRTRSSFDLAVPLAARQMPPRDSWDFSRR